MACLPVSRILEQMDIVHPISLPTNFELPSGQTVTVRMIRSADAPLLVEMFQRLSKRSQRLRYHAYTADLPLEQAIVLADLDPARQVALVAVYRDDTGEHIVAETRFARASAGASVAETTVVVRDDFKKLGLGTHIFKLLVSIAGSIGIEMLFGWVMSENSYMLGVFRRTNLPIRVEHHAGEMLVEVFLAGQPKKKRVRGLG